MYEIKTVGLECWDHHSCAGVQLPMMIQNVQNNTGYFFHLVLFSDALLVWCQDLCSEGLPCARIWVIIGHCHLPIAKYLVLHFRKCFCFLKSFIIPSSPLQVLCFYPFFFFIEYF
jgi:hypothetical protein